MRLTVIIPTRERELSSNCATLRTLRQQSFQNFKIVIQYDKGRGANWARNEGFKAVDTELVMFCDDDIEWAHDALEIMIDCLNRHPEASYVYCGYSMGRSVFCMYPFNPQHLQLVNFVSTMSILRTRDFIEFDENIQRLQDWDLWLTLLERGKQGVWCGLCLFHTEIRNGITLGNIPTSLAKQTIWAKHGISIEKLYLTINKE